MSDKEASTASSYLDYAKSTVASIASSITGNPADQREADANAASADAKSALSHTAAKAGPYTATAEGGVAKDDPRRQEGSWNQTLGSGKEMVGNLVGAEGLKQEGIAQNQAGKEQEAAGQLSDLGKGAADRVTGAVGGAVAGVLGDKQAQEKYQEVHDQGKAQQRGAEIDIQKQAPPSE